MQKNLRKEAVDLVDQILELRRLSAKKGGEIRALEGEIKGRVGKVVRQKIENKELQARAYANQAEELIDELLQLLTQEVR